MIKSRKLKIGLLGGSFNPAHLGHLHISEIALRRLGLGQVWWLVAPQNPLKSEYRMDFERRMESAKKIVGKHPRIKVLDFERKFGTRFTVDTLRRLKLKYPHYQFYWLMGADNLVQLPRWKKWREILRMAPMHVFDRDRFFYKAIGGRAYQIYKSRIFYHLITKNPLSSTALRRLDKKL